MNVTCPICLQSAEWVGCAGCGDDFGTLVCRHCGATMPGVCLSDLPKKTDSEKPEPVEGKACSRED